MLIFVFGCFGLFLEVIVVESSSRRVHSLKDLFVALVGVQVYVQVRFFLAEIFRTELLD